MAEEDWHIYYFVSIKSLLSTTLSFDTISHQYKLLHKLNNHGIRGNALQLIKIYLSNRTQYESALDENFNKLPVEFRESHGSVMGPLLFKIYINDIHR